MERRLAAILAADVVGYSRLMGGDEAGTLAALKRHRKELIGPKAAQYNGRTIKLMGDGALMEFPSVVEAVTFAVEVQLARRIGHFYKPLVILFADADERDACFQLLNSAIDAWRKKFPELL